MNHNNWGYSILIKTSELYKYLDGYNKCILGVYYSFYKYERGKYKKNLF